MLGTTADFLFSTKKSVRLLRYRYFPVLSEFNHMPFSSSKRFFCLCIFAVVLFSTGAILLLKSPPTKSNLAPHNAPDASYGRIEMSFEANKGQTDDSVDFLARGAGYALFLKPAEAVFSLSRSKPADAKEPILGSGRQRPENISSRERAVLRMQLIGANDTAEAVGTHELEGKANYFVGNDQDKWLRDVPTFGRVRYSNVYDGVDIEYYGKQQQLEYDFRVAPGADYRQIALKFAGADSVRIEEETGDLLIDVNGQKVRQQKPIVYQKVLAEKRPVDASFVINESSHVGFDVGQHDSTLPLVIDPVLVYSSYLGGSGSDSAEGMALDSLGNVYLTGYTTSTNFPLVNPIQGTISGDIGFGDVFVAKINPTGSAIVYSTFLGGAAVDQGLGIAVDTNGNVYVTGRTSSTNFPTVNPFQSTRSGTFDSFVTKINTSGSAIVYSTYLGGNGSEFGNDIEVDAAGNAYVGGDTTSSTFPVVNALQATNAGGTDAFVSKVNPAGSALTYSTYLGGTALDACFAIAVNAGGEVFLTGVTAGAGFPVVNAIQSTFGGGPEDGFVTQLNSGGSALNYSTYIGGSNGDRGHAIAIDLAGNAYITGATRSTNFPTVNPILGHSTVGNFTDAFVTKVNSTGSAIAYSTYLGGNASDDGNEIAVNEAGDVYVIGTTSSTNFPRVDALQGGLAGVWDAFITKINSIGSAIVYSTYLGSSGEDVGNGIEVDSSGNAYIVGRVASSNFPTINAIQPVFGGAADAFVTKIADAPGAPTPTPTATPTSTPTRTPTATPTPLRWSDRY